MTEILRVRTVFTGFTGAPGLMTTYFRNPTAVWNPGDEQLALDRIKDAFTGRHANFPFIWKWGTQGQVDILEDTTGQVTGSLFGTPSGGAGASAVSGLAPVASGVLVRWLTSNYVGGRRIVGKTYLVPVGNNTPAPDGTLTLGAHTEFDAWGAAMLNKGATALQMVVWSRPRPARAAGPSGKPTAQAARAGSSWFVTSAISNSNMCILTSRRD